MKSHSPPPVQDDDGQHDEEDGSVADESLAGQARKSWIAKDRRLSLQNSGANNYVGSPTDAVGKDARSSRWEASTSDKTLKAPVSWHGGKSKLSPSRFAAGPFSPPLAAKKKTNRAQSPVSWKDDEVSLGSSIVRGSKVYRIQEASKTAEIHSFLPQSTSSNSRSWIRKMESGGDGGESPRTMLSSSGLSLEALPDRDKLKKNDDSNDPLPPIKEPPFSVPFETPYEEDECEDETTELNDKEATLDDEDEESESEEDEEMELQDIDRTQVREFVVDRVPRKQWSSENIRNSPIWPPIIKVRSYEKGARGDVSGMSIGSGFTDDDYLTDDFSSDEDTSFADNVRRQPPERRTSYRIRYGGPTNLNLDSYKVDDRFQSHIQQPDGAPNMPSRVTDSTPNAPPRRQSSLSGEDCSVDMSDAMEPQNRPDVWITALSGAESQNVLWNVRRVWDLEKEDDNEREHSVNNRELFSKIKTLVGAASSVSSSSGDKRADIEQKDGMPKMPTRSWQIQEVVERRGKLENLEPGKDLAEEQFNENIDGMAKAAVVELKENTEALDTKIQKLQQRRIEKTNKKSEIAPVTEAADNSDFTPPWQANLITEKKNDNLSSKSTNQEQEESNANRLATPVSPLPTPTSDFAQPEDNTTAESPLPEGVSPSPKPKRKGKKEKSRATSRSPRAVRLSKSSGDQAPQTPRRHQSNAQPPVDMNGATLSPVSKKGKKKSKKNSKKRIPKEKKQISAADMYLAASSSDSEDNDDSPKRVRKGSSKEKKLGSPKIRRNRAGRNMISVAAMVQGDSSESDSDSSKSGARSPPQRRDPRLPKGSTTSTPWWDKQGSTTPKSHTPKKGARPSPNERRSPPLSDKRSMK
jgi:hypothetical protein